MSARWSIDQYREFVGQKKPIKNKYRNTRIKVNGKLFHSVAEASFYLMLVRSRLEGDVARFFMQVPISLCEETGQRYLLDFLIDDGQQLYYVDVKGAETKDFKSKKKLVEARHDIRLLVLKGVKSLIPRDMWGQEIECSTIRSLDRLRIPGALPYLKREDCEK